MVALCTPSRAGSPRLFRRPAPSASYTSQTFGLASSWVSNHYSDRFALFTFAVILFSICFLPSKLVNVERLLAWLFRDKSLALRD